MAASDSDDINDTVIDGHAVPVKDDGCAGCGTAIICSTRMFDHNATAVPTVTGM
jgi:hypothetical protein